MLYSFINIHFTFGHIIFFKCFAAYFCTHLNPSESYHLNNTTLFNVQYHLTVNAFAFQSVSEIFLSAAKIDLKDLADFILYNRLLLLMVLSRFNIRKLEVYPLNRETPF